MDFSNPNGVDRLVTTQSTRLIQDASGITFAVSKTAQDIFDHRNPDDSLASDNIFAAVNSLRVALANNDQPGINAAIASIKTAQDYLSQQLAFYGGVQNQISNALDVAQKFQLQDQTALSQRKGHRYRRGERRVGTAAGQLPGSHSGGVRDAQNQSI